MKPYQKKQESFNHKDTKGFAFLQTVDRFSKNTFLTVLNLACPVKPRPRLGCLTWVIYLSLWFNYLFLWVTGKARISFKDVIYRTMISSLSLLFALLIFGAGSARGATIDILLVYDTTATSWVSSNGGGMEAFSLDAVSRMNQAMDNSDVDLTFRLVHSMSVNYTHSSNLSTDLGNLRTGRGNLAEVHSKRNEFGADVVAMLVDTGSAYGYVGIGYLLTSWTGQPDLAFTVNAIRSVDRSHTLTHEVGHNLGAHHSKHQTADPGPNTYLNTQYSAGWYFTGSDNKAYHTIMAYNWDGRGNSYQSAPLFSTPLIDHNGTKAGHSADGDNARLIRETKNIVASYRESVVDQELTINPESREFSSSSYSEQSVDVKSNQSWTAVSDSSWISVTSGSTGQNDGSINYSINENTGIEHRTGTITIKGGVLTRIFTVQQEGAEPYMTIDPTERSHSSSTYANQNIEVDANFTWSAASNQSWITISSGNSNSGKGTIRYNVSENTGVFERNGTIRVNGGGLSKVFKVHQEGIIETCSLEDSFNTPELSWTTGGDHDWFGQYSTVYNVGECTARSGIITDNQNAWMQTSVTGPGTITFRWKVSSERAYDFLKLYVGQVLTRRISGSTGWRKESINIPRGHHRIQWVYTKDFSVSHGLDAGLVADVSWEEAPTLSCSPPGTISVPETSETGIYEISWDRSETEGVTYIVQEAADSDFNEDQRIVCRTRGTSCQIANTRNRDYYYRIKAVRSGNNDSEWKNAPNPCEVRLPSWTLAAAFDDHEQLPANYLINTGEAFNAGERSILHANELMDQTSAIVNSAANHQDLSLNNLLIYSLNDSLDNLWTRRHDQVFTEASGYSLDHPEGTDFGIIPQEKADFIKNATNYQNNKWQWIVQENLLSLTVISSNNSPIEINSTSGHSGTTPYTLSNVMTNTDITLEAPEYITSGMQQLSFLAWSGCTLSSERIISINLSESTSCMVFYETSFLPFADTGQTSCFNNEQEIICPNRNEAFFGQDAQYQPHIPRSYTKMGINGAELPDTEPHIDQGGRWIMVRDNNTGLIWEIKTQENKNNQYTWEDAQDIAITELNSAQFGGFNDWRLPSPEELSSIIKWSQFEPAVDSSWFPDTFSQGYWSSKDHADIDRHAWRVHFFAGNISSFLKSNRYHVRAVRSEQSIEPAKLINNGDGTVTDPVTGLMWQYIPHDSKLNWKDALAYAEDLNLAGHSDWRLPNINELQTLIDYSKSSPAINEALSTHIDIWGSNFWSSTSDNRNPVQAWKVYFNSGSTSRADKLDNYYVRAVRAGQNESFGSLLVTINSKNHDGPAWRHSGTDEWIESGTKTDFLTTGKHVIEFKTVENMKIPESEVIVVERNKTIEKDIQYKPLLYKYNLLEAISLYESEEIPEPYIITLESKYEAGILNILDAYIALKSVEAVTRRAKNADEFPALNKMINYSLEDYLHHLWNARNDEIFTAAQGYYLLEPSGTDFGLISAEKAHFIRNSANYHPGIWDYRLAPKVLPGVLQLLLD